MQKRFVHQCACLECQQPGSQLIKVLHEQMNLLMSTLDEHQRRLYAGLESARLGYGGDRRIALITGLNVHTIAKGRQELEQASLSDRIRAPGSGRWRVEKKDPTITTVLDRLVENETVGDPDHSIKWKSKSLRRLSAALGEPHPASPPTVGRLLTQRDYSRKVNRKVLTVSTPHRNEQFEYLQGQKQAFLERGWPVLHIDTKKRELIGWFKNPGAAWCRDPHHVNVYDFRSLAKGIAIPYGLYDPVRNAGYVYVGTTADTAQFAVDAIVWWWQAYGQLDYAGAPELLLLAEGGGSNGYRPRLWKYALQHTLVNPTGLTVTVCHYPTGASKWNWVEHRLFSAISLNWAGQPLTSYAKMLNLLRATTTQQGLTVQAVLTRKKYPTKIKISDEQMAALDLEKHSTLPQWNYTIRPTTESSHASHKEC
jgi:hypothetical protein